MLQRLARLTTGRRSRIDLLTFDADCGMDGDCQHRESVMLTCLMHNVDNVDVHSLMIALWPRIVVYREAANDWIIDYLYTVDAIALYTAI